MARFGRGVILSYDPLLSKSMHACLCACVFLYICFHELGFYPWLRVVRGARTRRPGH